MGEAYPPGSLVSCSLDREHSSDAVGDAWAMVHRTPQGTSRRCRPHPR
jgi:hypothetical protein